MKNKLAAIFRTAAFPAVMTVITFGLFVAVYLFVTVTAVEPYYFAGLLFAVPFVCFGVVTYFTAAGKLKKVASSVITAAAIFVLGAASLYGFMLLSFTAATTTTDAGKYERVLRLSGYPENALIRFFPDKIPDGAKNVVFRYHPGFLQGGENFELDFKADADSVRSAAEKFSHKAKWTGKMGDSGAEKNGILSGSLGELGYQNLPGDFTIYLVDSKPYRPGDWNHGKVSLAAVSRQRNEIIYHAEDW